jgi:3-(3-hydroxy-phenyl)propionate hydroxylase
MEHAASPLPYRRAPELDGRGGRTAVAIVGAGLAGLALAVDLASRGVPSVLLGEGDRLSRGARGLCWTRGSWRILERLGVGEGLLAEAVRWERARVFRGDREIATETYETLPGERIPPYANMPQARIEAALLARCADFPALIDLRFRHRVTAVSPTDAGVTLDVYTEDGRYRLGAEYAVACDGARGAMRAYLGLDFPGRGFADRFLIADVDCALPGPAERLFWFEPPFHPGGSALLHRQPGDMVRIELQLGPDANVEAERQPEAVLPRVRAILGDRPCALREVRVWSFEARRLARFVHGRVVFVGDSAHVLPPFGARGGNSTLADVDNLGEKLAAVLAGGAAPALLDGYDTERGAAADAHLAAATRAADFLVPPSVGARALRDELVAMASDHDFARRLLNTGRLADHDAA